MGHCQMQEWTRPLRRTGWMAGIMILAATIGAYGMQEILPPDGTVDVDPAAVTLAWPADVHAQAYRVCLGREGLAIEPLATVTEPRLDVTIELVRGAHYRWRVDAVQAGDQVLAGPVWGFAVRPPAPTDPNLLAWYPLDEGAGDVAHDRSGNGLHANLAHMTWDAHGAPGLEGPSVAGTGLGTLTLPTLAPERLKRGLTLTGWFRVSAVDRPVTLWNLDSGAAGAIACRAHPEGPGKLSVHVTHPDGPVVLEADQVCPIEEWTHQALVLDPATGTVTLVQDGMSALACDGLLSYVRALGRPLVASLGGGPADPCGFAGRIDHVQVYARALGMDAIGRTCVGHPSSPGHPTPRPGAQVSVAGAGLVQWRNSVQAIQQDLRFWAGPDALQVTAVGEAQAWLAPGAAAGRTYDWQVEATLAAGVIRGPLWHFTVVERSMSKLVAQCGSWITQCESQWGKPVPNVAVVDLDGRTHRLSDYRGRHVQWMVWSPSCHACQWEMDHLSQLRETIAADKLTILAVTSPTSEGQARSLRGKHPELDVTFAAASSYTLPAPFNQVSYYPTHFFIAPDGTLKVSFAGTVPVGEIRAVLDAAWP